MDSALLLLIRLKFWGWLRRAGSKLGTARGLLLTAMGLMLFLPSLLGVILSPSMPAKVAAVQIEGFRRIAPFFFLVYCLAVMIFSPGDKAFAFTPAEVSFLFPAPFSRRALLGYKIVGNLGLTALSGLFLMFAMRQNCRHLAFGYFGIVLAFWFLGLFAMAVALIGQAVGVRATTWRRRLALGLLAGLALAVVATLGLEALRNFTPQTILTLERAPAVQAAVAPFRPFARAISADRLWPDFALWFGVSLALDLALVGAILALDAQYLEGAAASSERFYAKLERMRKGGPSVRSFGKKRTWKGIGDLPWWGGIGPLLWRQATTAVRDWARAVMPVVACVALAGLGIYIAGEAAESGEGIALGFGGLILGAIGFLMPFVLTFDFRADFERMEGLKTLPIPPSRLVLGQVAAPWALLTGSQLFSLALLAIGTRTITGPFVALAAFAPVLNALMFLVDNGMFLLFPSRPMAHTPGDIQAMGRMMLMMMAKMLSLGIALGLAAALGFAAYFLGGWAAALVVAWLAIAAIVLGLVPLVALAFARFDVASETPS